MESLNLLLSQALTPYDVHVSAAAADGKCLVTLCNAAGSQVLQRAFHQSQFSDTRALIDVADGLHRDLRVAEGRLEPCMIAAMRSVSQSPTFTAAL
ncbi:DUF3509 domain-containing protein [Pseudomonas sp. dw_358]|uniref:DUF3509 domain-containing protein n=1 Tax=Pseudomonas sp. dw_358 TaxID=2720083 RepID=UPI001BD4D84E|nr:DUF3509 domain-containing protein [Pseudomonas sp. dw_358]